MRITSAGTPLPDSIGREAKIINCLIVLCLGAGFACLTLFILPDQLKAARALPAAARGAAGPKKISELVRMETAAEEAKAARPGGTTFRFDPEGPPPRAAFAPLAEEMRPEGRYADGAGPGPAGGAGAAIEASSAEAGGPLALATDPEPRDEAPAQASPETQETTRGINGGWELKVHPLSSLMRGDMPQAEREKIRQRKPWLKVPAGLEADVAFWRDVYARYDRNQVLLHHPRRLEIVYDVVDLSDIERDVRLSDVEKLHLREKRVEGRRTGIVQALKKLASSPSASSLTAEERRIKGLFKGAADASAFRSACEEDGVRAQTGQRDKFIAGLRYSGRYLGEIEAIFESYDIPVELTRLVFVESMFNPRAVSSAGASGIFQFMRGTGKLYMRISDIVDERNDPIASAHAAARLLRHDHDILGSWPLAINAYNAGRGRMQQAVARMGTSDIGRIVRGFDHPAYGFASRNFFLEFLAAVEAAERAEELFGRIEWDPPLRYGVVRTAYNIRLPDVARIAGIGMDELMELNPAVTELAASGARPIPAGFAIRVPETKGDLFLAAASRAPGSRTGPVTHVVEEGESLETLSRMYGVEPQEIVAANKLVGRRLKPGQVILIPVGGTATSPRAGLPSPPRGASE